MTQQLSESASQGAAALVLRGICRTQPEAAPGRLLRGLLAARRPGAPGARKILSGISAAFESGRMTAIVGADGAGKTTLMRIMAGILPPTSGEVLVFGESLYADCGRLQANIGYMPQRFGLYEDLSVAENFALYADLFGLSEEVRRERIAELLAMTGLTDFMQRQAGRLSGGMKQKLGLACALLNHPRILLLDEPSVGVDPLSRKELWEILRRNAARENMCVVAATTYMDEAQLCDAVLVLEEGELRLSGAPQEIAQFARARTFSVRAAGGARLLQAALLDRADLVLDAVPEAGGVRVVLMPGVEPGDLGRAFPGVEIAARAPSLEDGYLERRRALLGRPDVSAGAAVSAAPVRAAGRRAGGQPVIAARSLVRRFGSFTAVNKTTFDVHEGEIFGLLGPNGAGKTTTFKMLCGLIEVTEGELTVAGVDLRRSRALARERMGYMSQKFSLYAGLTVAQNLAFFAGAYGLSGEEARARIETLAQTFGIAGDMGREAGALSGGYRQRLAMAVALINRPRILFLDEPTSGADIPTRRQFWRWMTQLAADGTTIVVTTHFMEEALYCDRILIQDAGEPLVLGTPEEVRGQSATMNEAFVRIVTAARKRRAAAPGEAS